MKSFIECVDGDLASLGFKQIKANYRSEKHVVYQYSVKDNYYFLTIFFNKNDSLEMFFKYSTASCTAFIKELFGKDIDNYLSENHWKISTCRLEGFYYLRNLEYFNNKGINSSSNLRPVIDDINDDFATSKSKFIDIFIKQSAYTIINEFDSIESVDRIVNQKVLLAEDYAKTEKLLPHFLYIPEQITAGVLVAKILERPYYKELLQKMKPIMRTCAQDMITTKVFNKLYKTDAK